jgi:hypothetical protein
MASSEALNGGVDPQAEKYANIPMLKYLYDAVAAATGLAAKS